jgi:D-glycero-beta-D-manno-heptose-7-phosphate kinase
MRELISRIADKRFLVVGDLYLDSYIFGQPARVSREAPIMVLEETRREELPGGGCAPALALAKLGARVSQIGVTGSDHEGERLRDSLHRQGVDISGVLIDPERPTTVKTRIVAEGAFNVFPQQISRIDRQDRSSLGPDIESALVERIRNASRDVDAVVISDYRSGVVTGDVVAAVRDGAPLGAVDSQGSLHTFAGLDLIKCNQAEAEQVLGQPLADAPTRKRLITELREELRADRLVVTLGAEGAAIACEPFGYREMPPLARQQVFDVTGAGDTVIAILTGAIAAGGDDLQALRLAQIGAGIVVARWGNVQASIQDLLDELTLHSTESAGGT